jgi:hypothetical protein
MLRWQSLQQTVYLACLFVRLMHVITD